MPDPQLQVRGGRNIGVEAFPVLVQAAGAPEVSVAVGGAKTTLLEATTNLRTPFVSDVASGIVISPEAAATILDVFFRDDAGRGLDSMFRGHPG